MRVPLGGGRQREREERRREKKREKGERGRREIGLVGVTLGAGSPRVIALTLTSEFALVSVTG